MFLCSHYLPPKYREAGCFFLLLSGSSDSTICLWSLENFNLLNTISLPFPVTMLDVSSDSVFLLATCEDNQLYLRSLATGTEIHCLRGHKAEVRPLACNRGYWFIPSQLIDELEQGWEDVLLKGQMRSYMYFVGPEAILCQYKSNIFKYFQNQ